MACRQIYRAEDGRRQTTQWGQFEKVVGDETPNLFERFRLIAATALAV
jgi:hypothetical protein